MKTAVNFYEFERAFKELRPDNFSYYGLKALFEYLEDFEDGTGEEIELDVIAICCDFTEYEDLKEYLNDYGTDLDKEDYEDKEEFEEAIKEEIQDKTQFIEIPEEDGFIIQAF